ncbi:hypothetical protein OHB00_49540 [Streptomyces sp. NBC_00631]|uniref:TRADD-N-associated membrane domain-containing protein n=1 Tax=Streptomyces sp. NBC_00631 TaxID=2975793 RepID=UPI0030E587B8
MARSPAYITEKQQNVAVILTSFSAGGLVVFFGWLADASYWFSIPVAVVVFGLTVTVSGLFLGVAWNHFDPHREDQLLNDLRGEDRQLGILSELNRQEVLRYHDIVTRQAAQSFRSGQLAATAGLLVVGVCLWVGLKNDGLYTKGFSGAIAAISTAVSAYINRTYMRMYEKSIDQLSRYFDQPVVTGYYLTAERMAKTSLDQGLRNRIIESVLGTAMHITTRETDPVPRQVGDSLKQGEPKDASGKEGAEEK